MLFLILLLGYALIIVELSYMRKDATSWEAPKENVGFMVLVRVQAVILLFIYLIEKGSYLIIKPSPGTTYGLHRLVVICSLRHSKCTWLFRTIRMSVHL